MIYETLIFGNLKFAIEFFVQMQINNNSTHINIHFMLNVVFVGRTFFVEMFLIKILFINS